MPVFLRLRDQEVDILTGNFPGSVAEYRFGGRVERLDDAIFVDGNDTVNGAVEHGAHFCLT